MARREVRTTLTQPFGDEINLNGEVRKVLQHSSDFTVLSTPRAINLLTSTRMGNVRDSVTASVRSALGTGADEAAVGGAQVWQLNPRVDRVHLSEVAGRDAVMEALRLSHIVHHVYTTADTGEEIVIDDRILLTLTPEGTLRLEELLTKYALVLVDRVGEAYLLRVTDATGMNPVKVSNALRAEPGVGDASPNILQQIVPHTPPLLVRQWYLSSEATSSLDVLPTAGIRAPEAWAITKGSPDIVLAIVDDGFDLGHPAFAGKRFHPEPFDFSVNGPDADPRPEGDNYHGTCVASIATAPVGSAIVGVAPDCTLLPIRIGFGSWQGPVDMVTILRYASHRADVINCSFGFSPTSYPPLPVSVRAALGELTRTGGRRGKGVVLVFSAANDDAPTSLSAAENINGVSFLNFSDRSVRTLPAGTRIHPGYPGIEGVVTVAAITSRQRKAGYSNWGPEVSICAPSNNDHFLQYALDPQIRARFTAFYRGAGMVAACNRPAIAQSFMPLNDNPLTTNLREDFFTESFGGTSGAAPVVSGVAALVLSVNQDLSAEQVRQILMGTADTDLDPMLDLADDPNLQGKTGTFVQGHSLFFGAGKVNALRAVERARALAVLPLGHPPDTLVQNRSRYAITMHSKAEDRAFLTPPTTGLVMPQILPGEGFIKEYKATDLGSPVAFASTPHAPGLRGGLDDSSGFATVLPSGQTVDKPPLPVPSILPKEGTMLQPSNQPSECIAILRNGIVEGSGVLIGPRTVLTAAHVLARQGTYGVTALTDANNASLLTQNPGGIPIFQGAVPIVNTVVAYPQNPQIDLALAYLDYNSGYTGGFHPLEFVNAQAWCLIAGYGPTSLAGAGGIRHAGYAWLNQVFSAPGPNPVPAYLRVGTREQGAVFTQGDSGGPLYLLNAQGNRFLAGIAYRTLPLNDDGGWYTAIAPFLNEIKSRIL